MAGIADEKTLEERSKAFDPKFAGPLDSRAIISSQDQLDIEYPINQRYIGSSVFFIDENREYIFETGLNKSDLTKKLLFKTFVLTNVVDLSVDDIWTFYHNLQTIEMFVKVMISGVEIKHIMSLLDVADPNYLDTISLDFTDWKTATGLTEIPINTKLIILY